MPAAMTTWVRCCFERGRLGHRHRKGAKNLDERYGDADISGPMDGGWNQLPSYPSEKRSNSLPSSRPGSRSVKQVRPGVGHFPPKQQLGQSLAQEEEPFNGSTEKSSFEKPPDFVYKPASEAFFKDMAGIGRAKYSPPTSGSSTDSHQRQVSVQSTGSLDPKSPGEIPRHPSYQPNMFSRRSTSPQGLSATMRTSPSLSQYSRENSPSLSTRARFDDHSYDMIEEELEKQIPIPPPLPPPTKMKPKKSKRAVTQELVPSTTELFG